LLAGGGVDGGQERFRASFGFVHAGCRPPCLGQLGLVGFGSQAERAQLQHDQPKLVGWLLMVSPKLC
jgi:hypothetical protein